MTMYGLSLTQPWATMMALGHKRIETRSWGPSVERLGDTIAIQASRGFPLGAQDLCFETPFFDLLLKAGLLQSGDEPDEKLPLGAVLAIATLRERARIPALDLPMYPWQPRRGSVEWRLGDYSPGRWMWLFTDIQPLIQPYPLRGFQFIFPINGVDEIAIRGRALPVLDAETTTAI